MKFIACSLLFFATTLFCNAQESTKETHQYFGVRVGVSIAHPNFSKGSPPSDFKTSWGPGFVGGVFLNVPISEKFTIQPEYLFRQMNSDISDPKTSLRFSYMSLPVLIKFNFTEKLALLAGPQFDLLIKADSESNGTETDITHETEERSIAATFGLEYLVWKTVALDARYMHGLNHIGMNRGTEEVREFKFEALQITASFGF